MGKKIFSIISIVALLLGILSGCTTQDGIKISTALIKNMEIKSASTETSVMLKVDTKGIEITEDQQKLIDQINNSGIKFNSKQDIVNNKAEITGNIMVNNELNSGTIYVDGQKAWFKMPFEEKYIEYNPEEFLGEVQKAEVQKAQEQAKQMVEKLTPVIKEFFIDYIKDYKFNFKNLKNKGISTIKTPEGNKEVTLYEISLDFDLLKDLTKYTNKTIEDMINDNSLKELVKSIIKISAEYNPEILEAQSIEETFEQVDTMFNELKGQYSSNGEIIEQRIDELFENIKKYCEIGPKGINITYGIDKDNYIIKEIVNMDLMIKDVADKDAKVNINLSINSTIYNINKTTVQFPKFNEKNVIGIKEFVETNQYFNNSPFINNFRNYFDSIYGRNLNNQKYVILQIDEIEAYTDKGVVILDAEPFIKNETTMVPMRFVSEALGANITWSNEDRAIICTDGDTTIQMHIDKTIAYVNGEPVELKEAPVIKNEKTMVPLRFIAEALGAKVSWDGDLRMITIEK